MQMVYNRLSLIQPPLEQCSLAAFLKIAAAKKRPYLESNGGSISKIMLSISNFICQTTPKTSYPGIIITSLGQPVNGIASGRISECNKHVVKNPCLAGISRCMVVFQRAGISTVILKLNSIINYKHRIVKIYFGLPAVKRSMLVLLIPPQRVVINTPCKWLNM